MAAVVTAQGVEEDGCLKIVTPYSNRATTLVFPPDASATIDGDQVTIVTRDREETVLIISQRAHLFIEALLQARFGHLHHLTNCPAIFGCCNFRLIHGQFLERDFVTNFLRHFRW
jgi:hypothetical protein